MRKRSFSQLKNSMSLDAFNSFCKKIAKEYANSEAHFARRYFCGHYNISESCFYKILEYVVENNLVDACIAAKISKKQTLNRLHYAEVHAKSIAMSVPTRFVASFARDLVENPEISKYELAYAYEWSVRVADLVLKRAVEENIAPDNIVDELEKRSIKYANPEKEETVRNFFKKLRETRNQRIATN